jgi:adenine-specific DNA-methyltransferase
MANNSTPLEQLKSFLNQLFQFDSQDLDFGVYKILHYKKREIANFIDQLLVDKVKAELQTLSADEAKQIQEQIAEFEKNDIIKGWLEADESEKKTLEKFGKDKINQYQELKAKATESSVSIETENQIYNHLTLFFSRYYDKGDFISKRRFGKNEKYVVPYNGEETHFHWANQDQYYIKSSETFNHYAFKVQTADSNLVVNFKLHNAQLEQGNVKAEETNFFMLSDRSPEIKEKDDSDLQFVLANKQPDVNEKEITIYFEYRPLGDDEKKKVKGNSKQDTLDEIAFDFLKKEFGTNPIFANLWKEREGKPLLLKKLQHYTRKNKHDFFIHKNLKGFLERELDYYIKSELVNVDDLYVSDTDSHFDRLKHNLKTIRVFKSIADTIIAFVSQIEDFQKKLWEKKKFVLSTEWVITIDRLVKYVGEEAAEPILEEVIKNEKQVTEWKEYFDQLPENISIINEESQFWLLPIDTKYFENDFKFLLLGKLSEKINLEESISGIGLKTDNYHGLNIMYEKFKSKIKTTYIDPPYNSGYSEIIYKNTFKHSSWISLMQNRINLAKEFMAEDSTHILAIDENEQERLGLLLKQVFGDYHNTCVTIVHNPSGQQGDNFSFTHEYAYFTYPNGKRYIGLEKRPIEEADIRNFRDVTGEDSKRESAKNCFYPIFIKNDKVIGFGDVCEEDYHPTSINESDGEIIKVYPIDPNGVERKWRFARHTVETIKDELFPHYLKKRGIWDIKRKKRDFNYKTVWTDSKYFANNHGTQVLNNIIGKGKFSFPKSIYTVKSCISAGSFGDENPIVLDYFAGSGTTFHSAQLLNRTGLNFKTILLEQGNYFYTTLLPRLKKIAYSFDWKDGKPKDGNMNGLGVFFKYQRLEQYEEALENIAFNASEDAVQKALEFEQYIPKYFLEFETKGSQTLVNTAAMQDPWDYQLKVWDGFTYDTEQAVDLVETFNYLIGLHMQKCITKELNSKKYQFIYGHNNANKNILAVWRSVKDWSVDDFKADAATLKTELKAFEYDLLYINDQAHIESYQPIEEVFKNKMLS